jgi:hypothetical protein
VTARSALRNFRQLRLAYAAGTLDIPEVADAIAQESALAAEMNQAAAVVELLGSGNARQAARDIYKKARSCAELYQERSIGLAGLDKVLGTRGVPYRYDADRAERLCDDLATAIEAFAGTARGEIAGSGAALLPRK